MWYWSQEKTTTRTHEEKLLCQFCAISLQKQAIFGICGNSEELSSYWYYYFCLLQFHPVYQQRMTFNQVVRGSSPRRPTSIWNDSRQWHKVWLHICHTFVTVIPNNYPNISIHSILKLNIDIFEKKLIILNKTLITSAKPD